MDLMQQEVASVKVTTENSETNFVKMSCIKFGIPVCTYMVWTIFDKTNLTHCVLRFKMANNWERVKEELTCAICQDLLSEPKILPCLHSFCTGCLKEWSGRLANLDPSKRHLECPLCRAKVLLSSSRAVEELPSLPLVW